MMKVLVAGGGHAEIPLIKELKNRGFFVGTVGNNRDGLGHQLADENFFIDFSNAELVNKVFIDEGYNLVIPGCNDFSMITASYVAEKNSIGNLDSLEITNKIHLKNEFRKVCKELELKAPSAISFDNYENALEYIQNIVNRPMLIKPVDLTGGKGISKISNSSDAENQLKLAFERSKIKKVVIEDFIEGSNHGFTSFIVDGNIKWYFNDDEYYYLDNYSVAGTSFPGSSKQSTLELLIGDLEKLAKHLELKDGLMHVQYIDNEGVPYIVEVMRRPPGDLYPNFVEEALYPQYTLSIIDGYVGNGLMISKNKSSTGFYARHCIKGFKSGLVKRIKYSNELKKYIVRGFDIWDNNQYLEDFLTQKLSIIILKFDNHQMAVEMNNNLYKHIEVIYHPE
jgi:hypothetical protein